MNEIVLVIAVTLMLVVAMMVLNRSVRLWVFRIVGMESRIEGIDTQTHIRASKKSTVRDIENRSGVMDIKADDESEVIKARNTKKD